MPPLSQIRLTNLIPNGGFEANAAGWLAYATDNKGALVNPAPTPTAGTILAPTHNETGSLSMHVSVSTQGLVYCNLSQPISTTVGNKYYFRTRVRLRGATAGTASALTIINCTNMAEIPVKSSVQETPFSDGLITTNITEWVLLDSVWVADTNTLNPRYIWQSLGNSGKNDLNVQIDNIVLVDLTTDFGGPGLEPPIFPMREGVNNTNFPNGHWDGSEEIEMPLPPVIETETLNLALRGRQYSDKIIIQESTGTEPFMFNISGLPIGHGLSIDAEGNMSGITNLDDGIHQFTISVTDHIGYQVSKQFELVVGEPPVIVDEFIPGASYGLFYTWSPTVDGSGPPSVSLSVVLPDSLPSGLSIAGDTISGTSTDEKTCRILITATNYHETVTKILTIGVYRTPFINTISPLANGILGEVYAKQISVSGVPDIRVEYLSGNLPPGLQLDEFGLLSGTPTQTGVYSFSVQATNDYGSYVKLFTLSVYEMPVITTTALGYARLGSSYSAQITANGSLPMQFSILSGSLPVGLTLNQSTGVISGSAMASGSSLFTVVASNIAGNSIPVQLTINSGTEMAFITTSPLPSGTVNVPYTPLVFEVDGLNLSASNVWSMTGQIPPGLSINLSNGTLTGTPLLAGVFNITVTVVSTTTVQTGTIVETASSPFAIEIGTPPVIISLPQFTGGVDRPFTTVLQASGREPIIWSKFQPPPWPEGQGIDLTLNPNGALSWLIPEEGDYEFAVIATNVFGDSAPVTFYLTITTPSIKDVELDDGIVGVPYTHAFSASGAEPFNWELVGNLPSGLFFDASTATIYGTPLIEEFVQFDIRLSNVGGSVQEKFTLTINSRPVIINGALNSGYVTYNYSQTLQASGTAPVAFSIVSGALPPGLTLAVAIIQGYPTAEGTFVFKVSAENLTGIDYADEREFSITILPSGAPIIQTAGNLLQIRDIGFSQTFSASGDTPIEWTFASGSLPAGVAFNGVDTISGIPTEAGIFSFSLSATNYFQGDPFQPRTDTRIFTLTVLDPPIITTPATLKAGTTGKGYSQEISASGDIPIFWAALSPLPEGLAIGQFDGVISGIPTKAGNFSFWLQATNQAGTISKQFTLSIKNAGGTFLMGEKVHRLFIGGYEVKEAFVNGVRIYRAE